MKVVHFGAGSLGLGLILPVLESHVETLTVVDVDQELTSALSEAGGYTLELFVEGVSSSRKIRITNAIHTEQREGLEEALNDASLVTTSVRAENAGMVASHLGALQRRLHVSRSQVPRVIACENVEAGSRQLAQLSGASLEWASYFLETEVDRICQSRWPQALEVRAEEYLEWVIEADCPFGGLKEASGVQFVPRVEPFFYRKRYLVNTVADYIAFLGSIRGFRFLHQAASDSDVVAKVRDVQVELSKLLARRYHFTESHLREYSKTALRRMQEAWIERDLSTVARGHLQKLKPEERFVKPFRDFRSEFGETPRGLENALVTVIAAGKVNPADLEAAWKGNSEMEALLRDRDWFENEER